MLLTLDLIKYFDTFFHIMFEHCFIVILWFECIFTLQSFTSSFKINDSLSVQGSCDWMMYCILLWHSLLSHFCCEIFSLSIVLFIPVYMYRIHFTHHRNAATSEVERSNCLTARFPLGADSCRRNCTWPCTEGISPLCHLQSETD